MTIEFSAAAAGAVHPLAAPVNDNTPWVGPGLLGFIIVVIIGLATWFLGRSMAKQLRKLDAGRAEQQEPQTPKDERETAAPPRDPKLNGAH
ncbi:hypothetical protein KGA66_05325 [Actinocrinis puniceicyclus]|uniref:Uncharacterized protein n=1 Tax=Actinocrinis puniceicyclus TaxID=977794 RepID=A0A8J7WHW6_9ACTN|nr:hypothetical protein [Actinocrinis puniceicyclus]MBS2962456.1 hypothetical protein [Actinocrinis puniceicyclus]